IHFSIKAISACRIWRKILPYTIVISIIFPLCLFFILSFRPVNYLLIPLGESDIYYPYSNEHVFPWFDSHRISVSTQ
ncbi:hypothetical protein PRIPAC_81671, partial [Pristionchus pacificus]